MVKPLSAQLDRKHLPQANRTWRYIMPPMPSSVSAFFFCSDVNAW